ncbi:hypothetical protein A2U01_0042998, partial [Trifolium medium]|nr:hypothetical protein [Trifolium medium]
LNRHKTLHVRALSLGDVLRSPGDMRRYLSLVVANYWVFYWCLIATRSPGEARRHGLC